ncbi:hypothetical protein C0J52_00672 [Blattella germanica]|nr:hypothetical protein C0J52_00672 [Blattella germanica]
MSVSSSRRYRYARDSNIQWANTFFLNLMELITGSPLGIFFHTDFFLPKTYQFIKHKDLKQQN